MGNVCSANRDYNQIKNNELRVEIRSEEQRGRVVLSEKINTTQGDTQSMLSKRQIAFSSAAHQVEQAKFIREEEKAQPSQTTMAAQPQNVEMPIERKQTESFHKEAAIQNMMNSGSFGTFDEEKTGKDREIINVNWGSFIKLKQKPFEDDYVIMQELGKGAFGTVCKVRLKSNGLMRAMKSIKKSSLIKQDEQRIFAEMAILKQLDHPNIVKLHEIYEWKNYFYLITELCEGGELFDRIRLLKQFTERDAAEVMKSILGAVVYLHKQGIVHRDLKPENLLYVSRQHRSNLKIIDFGTSRRFQKGKPLTKQVGTAYYIAPEVLNRRYDEKCDVWSCGIILYILLCGYPPFRGSSEKEILARVREGNIKFESYGWKNVSGEAISLIKAMLERDPSVRLSAYDAINSKWINSTETKVLAMTTLENLRNFHFQNRLKAVVMTYVASQLYSNQDKAQLEKVFRELDNDGDGVIERQQLIQAFETHYRDHKCIDISGILRLIDTNNSGKIDFTQFLVAASSEQKLLNMTRLDNAFSYFDIDHSGYITIEEIRVFLNDTQDSTQSIRKLFLQVDVNGDGRISKEEFIELLLRQS